FATGALSVPNLFCAPAKSIQVSAGDFPRENTLVSFPVSSDEPMLLMDRDHNSIPVQQDGHGYGWFILPKLEKGRTALLSISRGASPKSDGVQIGRNGTKYEFRAGNHALMEYQAEPGALPREDIKSLFVRGGYLHPIRTLAGKSVTDDFPPNHIHHHGVWWAWTKTEFEGRHPDFWNMGDGKGKVEFEAVDKTFSGPVFARFQARHRFVDMTAEQPKTALKESWDVRAFAPSPKSTFWLFDFQSSQTCATASPLKLPEYRYGGLGFRGNWAWNGKDKTDFLTSEGERDREKGQGTRARWCDISGLVDGQRVGIAILCHPSNFRAPQPMRLHPTEPFFNFAPQEAGDMAIEPGQPYLARYRFVVHDGPPDKDLIERLWNDYAHPPAVEAE
ncbi:MAG TPA: PmoA family protein, partial [Candidatus Saccharimonadales bacterium]|nr:PmoA family protein [Candidatus Saccharimonadales bacterium]